MKQSDNIGKNLDSEKSKDIRHTNIVAARAVADVVRTSLGPKGMDKMVSKLFYSLRFYEYRFKIKMEKCLLQMMAPQF
jgi:chaperonin GroEL (HSP60 family)